MMVAGSPWALTTLLLGPVALAKEGEPIFLDQCVRCHRVNSLIDKLVAYLLTPK